MFYGINDPQLGDCSLTHMFVLFLYPSLKVPQYMFQLINVIDLLFATPSEMEIDHDSPGSYLRIAQHRIKQVLSRAKCVEKQSRAAQSEDDDASRSQQEKTTHFNEYKDVELYNPHVLIQSPNEKSVEDMNEVDNIKYFTPFVTVWNRRVVHEAIQSPDRKCLKRLLDLAELDSRTVSPQELYLLNTAFQLLCRWMRAIVSFIE